MLCIYRRMQLIILTSDGVVRGWSLISECSGSVSWRKMTLPRISYRCEEGFDTIPIEAC